MKRNFDHYMRRHLRSGERSPGQREYKMAMGSVLLDIGREIEELRKAVDPGRYEWDVIPVAPNRESDGERAESPSRTIAVRAEKEFDALIDGKADEGWTFYDARPWGPYRALFVFRRER